MTKYEVTMYYVESKKATFVVQAKDPDELHNLISELDLDFLEKNAGFKVCDYEFPSIEDYAKVPRNTPVNKEMQSGIDEIAKAWKAL